ncbi:MAG: hypothetical protein KKI14_01370, partial [Nanoarchaeota archaeon]|nr:hypothetical protein [Nanoarchaeota archaeon]
MSLFSKKSKLEEAEEKAKEIKKKEMEKIKKLARIELPSKSKTEKFKSTEYKQFLQETEKKPGVFYERACSLSERILPIKLDDATEMELSQNLSAGFINTTARGVVSFTIISAIVLSIFLLFSLLMGLGSTMVIILMLFVGIVIYYIYNYPSSHAKSMGMKMSSDAVLAILYMVIYMRTSPNLEGALRFATQNLKGPLAWDLKKLMWDIEVGKYASADDAIVTYVYKWKDRNKEFAESLHLLRSIATEPVRKNIIFDETINVILNGTRERAKHYANGLRMPMMIIHAMGVLLPIMGLVLFPVVMIFMGDAVKPIFIFLGYDILLPAFIYFFTDYILQSKPPTFSQPDISLVKGIAKLGYYRVGKFDIPILPIALAIGIPVILFGILGITNLDTYVSVSFSMLIIIGISLIISVYTFLDSYQKMKMRNDIEKIEEEFSVALFQLGNLISSGSPIELAIDQAKVNLKNMKITDMLDITSMNMKKFGYTLEQALFDKDVGAVWYYPSSLIRSIMQTILES